MKFTNWIKLREMKSTGGYANSVGAGQVFQHTINNMASNDGFNKLKSKYSAGSEKDLPKYNINSLFKKNKKNNK